MKTQKRPLGALPLLAVGAALLASGVSRPANAAIIYDNGPGDEINGNEMSYWIEADDFVLGSSSQFDTVKFWDSSVANSYKGSYFWSIYSDAGATPGTSLFQGETSAVTREVTGRSHGSYLETINTFSVGNINLGPGTYWLGLHNGPLSDTTFNGFYWATSAQIGNSRSNRAPFDGTFEDANGTALAFQLIDSEAQVAPVPELSTMTLMLVAMAGLMGTAWMRKKKERATDAPLRLPAGMA